MITVLSDALLPTELTTDVLRTPYYSFRLCAFSICVLQLWHSVECVSFSLSLTASSSLALARRACVYAGFTRCWFNHWTDDRLSQQLRRQIHSPTLSRLPLHFFSACFVYIRLSLSYSHHISVLTFFPPAWHTCMDCLQTEPHTISVSLVLEY